jgi:hypothetical protein
MVRRFLAVALALVGAVVAAGPAEAASCTVNCYRYWADVTIAAWTTPSTMPLAPGSIHTYTVVVTSTGWRTGGSTGPVPAPGPDIREVYAVLQPASPYEVPIARVGASNSGVPFRCTGGPTWPSLACLHNNMETFTSGEFTRAFQVPPTPGTYTITIYADSVDFTELDENNNSLTLTYVVGYLP